MYPHPMPAPIACVRQINDLLPIAFMARRRIAEPDDDAAESNDIPEILIDSFMTNSSGVGGQYPQIPKSPLTNADSRFDRYTRN